MIHADAPSTVHLPAGDWPTALDGLCACFPRIAREQWLDRVRRGRVLDADGAPIDERTPHRAGMKLRYFREVASEPAVPGQEVVLHADEHLVVVDKPHFLPVIPAGAYLHETLLVRLRKTLGEEDLVPIHRLDRETAGVVIFSRNAASRGTYQSMFQKRVIDKEYEALAPRLHDVQFPFTYRSRMVEGDKFFVMKEVEGEPNSETLIDVVEHRGELTLYRLYPHTGRQHQLRVHLSALGIPIVNDAFYPVALPCKQDDVSSPLKLLARAISFIDPLSGDWREFRSRREL